MSINKVSSAGAGVDNSKSIVDSTRPGFISNYQKPTGQPLTETEQTQQKVNNLAKNLPKVEDIAKEVSKTKVTKNDEQNAANVMKLLLSNNLKNFNAQDFNTHNMLFYRYDAKNKENAYDKSPLVFVLRKSRGYLLGLNLHWTPVPLRLILIKYVLQVNKQNIRMGLPLNITYQMLKPVIQKLNLGPVIRLYIFGRISRRGLVIPPEMWMSAAKLRSESFSGGYSADQLYKMALSKTKEWKTGRKRSEKVGNTRSNSSSIRKPTSTRM